jgi:cell fate (sporulation/competence/biofilm development) regulator YlbF (YheA/YmcA/DUF963 family)
MPVDTQQILDEAEKLGQLVSQHPAVDRYKQAQKAVADDAEASRLMADFERAYAKLAQQAEAGLPVTDAQRDQLESIQSKIVSHIKVKNLNLAQVEFVDLLRKVGQTIQKPLAGGAGPAAPGAPKIATT